VKHPVCLWAASHPLLGWSFYIHDELCFENINISDYAVFEMKTIRPLTKLRLDILYENTPSEK
jgi:hypothetical protein